MKTSISFIVLFLFCNVGIAQEFPCGTSEPSAEQVTFMRNIHEQAIKNVSKGRVQNTIVDIPIKAHIIRESNSQGGLSEAQLTAAINTANNFYENANIKFSLFGDINFIDNSDYYDFDAADEGKLAVPNDVANVINVYFFNSISSQGSALCGYTRFPPSEDRVFMANGCTTSGNTFAHELGHYFTLYHTHGKTNTGTTDELVDGSNCATAGDNLCDTPADPNLSGKVNGSCQYTGGAKDDNGDFFNPMVANIMSYAPGSCRNMLTADQYFRVRTGFENGRSYLNFTSQGFSVIFNADQKEICAGNEVRFEAVSFGGVSFQWSFPGGTPSTSTSKTPKVTYLNPGVYNVSVTAMNSNDQATSFSRSGYITVIDPLANSTIDEVVENFGSINLPPDWSIDNSDLSLTFELNDFVDRNEGSTGSLWVNNYNYSTEVPRNEDVLVFPNMSKEGIRGFNLSFDYAYTFRKGGFEGAVFIPDVYDTLQVILDDGCNRENMVLWAKGGDNLKTAPETDVEFFPAADQWNTVSIDYSMTSNQAEYSLISLKNVSYNGNNLFIDNIRITPDYSLKKPTNLNIVSENQSMIELSWSDRSLNEVGFVIERNSDGLGFDSLAAVGPNITSYIDSAYVDSDNIYRVTAYGVKGFVSEASNEVIFNPASITSIEESIQPDNNYKIWPNPTKKNLNFKREALSTFNRITIKNFFGQTVYDSPLSEIVNISHLDNGLYIVKLHGAESTYNQRIIKIK